MGYMDAEKVIQTPGYEYRLISENGRFAIAKATNKKTGRKKYLIDNWDMTNDITHEQIIHFDPFNNRKIRSTNYTWAYNTLKDAEELLIVAALKGWC